MDREVAKSLGDLEQKLQQLERELTSLGRDDASPSALGYHSTHPAAAGYRDTQPATAGHRDPLAPQNVERGLSNPADAHAGVPGRLVDEAIEHTPGSASRPHGEAPEQAGADAEETSADTAFGGPALWGGEELPARAATPVERDWGGEVRETAFGEIPTPPSAGEIATAAEAAVAPPPTVAGGDSRTSIDVAELARFEQRLRRTMQELLDEYNELLSRVSRA